MTQLSTGAMECTTAVTLLFVPCGIILLTPVAVFVMLMRFYRVSVFHMLRCMLEQVAAAVDTTKTVSCLTVKKARTVKKKRKHR